jgi:hypothetical protein
VLTKILETERFRGFLLFLAFEATAGYNKFY